ncbi:MAG: M23 family metallopeptidase [Actinomycetota bacterium]
MRKIVISAIAALSVVAPAAAGSAATAPTSPAPVTTPTATDYVLRRIVVPVEGKFSHADDFGDPRSGGRTHQGNDMMVTKGRPLLAAVDGKVTRIQVDTGSNSGNMLTIRDDEGWKYHYIHINNDTPGTDDGKNPLEHAFAKGIQVGSVVKAGQVVAYAGDSGNAESTGPHLHFEIVPPDGSAINPYPSLRIAQGIRYGAHCAFDANPRRKPDPDSAPGYWALGADGGVFAFGEAGFYGSTGNIRLAKPSVAMAAVPGGEGYWFAATDGGIFAFGEAGFYGSTGNMKLAKPIVGMAATPSGEGYWLVASDGGIFSFGDAGFYGSTGDMKLAQPIVGMSATPSGEGYWMVAKDGGIFSFGDAKFFGSTGDTTLNQPIVGMAGTSTGKGYWLVAKDGGIFTFGDAVYHGSLPGTGLCEVPAAARIHPSSTGKGYWIAATDGSVWAFGDAKDYGSPKSLGLQTKGSVLDLVAVRLKATIPAMSSPDEDS